MPWTNTVIGQKSWNGSGDIDNSDNIKTDNSDNNLFPDFMFPKGTRREDMEVCHPQEIKLFCKDYVEKAEVMFILASFACMLVILSLVS